MTVYMFARDGREFPDVVVRVDDVAQSSAQVCVWMASAWESDGTPIADPSDHPAPPITDYDPWASACVKWDGCVHWDIAADGEADAGVYEHTCSAEDIDTIHAAMRLVLFVGLAALSYTDFGPDELAAMKPAGWRIVEGGT